MSLASIRAALEVALNAMSPALSTAWENAAFSPVAGTPYQDVSVQWAKPNNPEFGSRHDELGDLFINLMYPLQVGTAAIAARADLVRTTFYRGATFTSGASSVLVTGTPEVRPGIVAGDRFSVLVKIPFFSQVQ